MNVLALLPVLLPLVGAAIALLARRHWGVQMAVGGVSLAGAAGAGLWMLAELVGTRQGRPFVYVLGGWAPPAGIVLVGDVLSALFVVMSAVVLALGLLYAWGAKDRAVRYPAFVPLFLTLSAAMCGTLLTGDVFNFFVFAELLVISAAVLTSLSDDSGGAEASWKYFYVSTFAGVMLLGASGCFYAGYGTLNMADLAARVADNPRNPLLAPAAAMLMAALLVKCAAVPFHFWQPDFHTVAPTPVSAMLSGIVVKVGVFGLIRATTLYLEPIARDLLPVVLAAGVVGVVFGGLSALGTHNAKRVLAYSTLAQVGFILVGVGLGTEAGLAAAVVFSVNHALIKSAMLMLAGAMASRAHVKSAALEVLTGVGNSSRPARAAGWLFLVGAMALVGMPPTNGFVSKLQVLVAAGDGESARGGAGLVVLLCVASVLTLLYCFRIYSRVWWEAVPEGRHPKTYGDSLLAPAILIGMCLLLGLFPAGVRAGGVQVAGLGDVAQQAAKQAREPWQYFEAVMPRNLPKEPSRVAVPRSPAGGVGGVGEQGGAKEAS